jgi:hypothetical protein
MGKKPKKRPKGYKRDFEASQTYGAKLDQRDAGGQAAWGTGSSGMGRVKMESDEAKLATCPDCGHSGGKHARMCGRA